jgi:BirA family biotin operon repressor/biotin-[acetyl-CoA-carboxylase] ligase
MIRHHLSSVDSTNDWAKRNLSLLDPSLINLVTADAQSAGRGSYGRNWYSPEHQNIYATFILFVNETSLDQSKYVQLLAQVTKKILEDKGIKASIKWPNDLQINHKKVAGILLETSCFQDKTAIIMGIGLNVNMPKEELVKLDQPATSLMVETNTFWDKDVLINALVEELSQQLIGLGKA